MQVESLPVDEGNQAKGARVFLLVWWRFFWRSALLWAALLLGGGNLLNLLSKFILDSSFLFSVTLIYSGTANVLASFLVFFYILNRPFKKSVAVLSIANGRSVFRMKLKSWFHYYWRFILFSFGLAMLLGALLPIVAHWLGEDPLAFLKYSKYVGNISMIPASLLAFWLLLRRKGGKSLLQITVCGN